MNVSEVTAGEVYMKIDDPCWSERFTLHSINAFGGKVFATWKVNENVEVRWIGTMDEFRSQFRVVSKTNGKGQLR